MRSFKLTTQAVAAAALLALAPAGASAARGRRHLTSGARSGAGRHRAERHRAASHRRRGLKALNHPRVNAPRGAGARGCRIDIFAEPHTVTNESVQLFGQLRCPASTPVEGQTVTIYQHTTGTPGFQMLGTTTTKEHEGGFYSLVDSSVTADTRFYASAVGARSRITTIKLAPAVELGSPTPAEGSQLYTGRGREVTFAGTVAPADEGAEVILQRENAAGAEDWNVIQRGTLVGKEGKFTIVHRFVVPGDANIRVLVRPHGKFSVRGTSTPISYQISQAENPALTIDTSNDAIPYGESVTISGKLAAGSGQTVWLYSHPRGSLPFTEVTKTTTEAEGKYSFSEKPGQNTFYQVRSATVRSSVLFQGVKYVLTPATPPTAVKQGETVTFTGTVSPDQPSLPVYLEHANEFGGGYHVVGVGTLNEGKYSIARTFLTVGKQMLRIKVPGNPANQATVSAPFDIEVTPAPLPLLKPAPATRLPSEGQV
jgi:hypothetical protein